MVSAAVARSVVKSNFAPEPLQKSILLFFFISGIPALIYQIVWQRALFAIYGVNIESVAVVVSVFMLGLGLGSILGGYISKFDVPLLAVFAVAEAITGVYGFCSLSLFHHVAIYTAGAPLFKTGCLAFMLLAIPTILMGSTLPLLLEHCVRQLPNIGRAAGLLYFANTLGSACACFLAGRFLMGTYGLRGSARIAAWINIGISICILAEYLRTRNRAPAARKDDPQAPATQDPKVGAHSSSDQALFAQALVLAAVGGFIALAYEIIWCRVFSFATGTNPKVFAYLLCAYLAGIAVGSLVANHLCSQRFSRKECLFSIGAALFGGNLWALFVAPEFANLWADMPRQYAVWFGFSFVAFAAALLSMIFPLICHFAIDASDKVGARISYLYFSNILGSSLGSFVVGYVAFEYFSLKTLSLILAALGMGVGIFVLIRAGAPSKRTITFSAVAVIALIVGAVRLTGIYDTLAGMTWTEVVEDRHDVITVNAGGAIYGGGAYDGMFNVDPIANTNGITRLYAALTLHPAPQEVLMVGLSSGSWAQVIVNDPRVKHLTVVEINSGYLKIIPHQPEVSSLLRNPKLTVVIDDGRRWLAANPGQRYDLIVMNTSIHWRANITNLLSWEFMQMVREHLKPRGMYFFNTTSSPDAQLTACESFRNVIRISNFVAGSDAPIRMDKRQLKQFLLNYTVDRKKVIANPMSLAVQQQFEQISSDVDTAEFGRSGGMFEYGPSLRATVKGARIVTDNNMAVEWSRGLSDPSE